VGDNYQKTLRKTWHSKQEQARREFVAKLLRIYDHNWRSDLDEQMRSLFSKETYDALRMRLDTSINIAAWYASEIGCIYSKPATRTIDGSPDGLEPYLNDGELDAALDEAARICVLTREIFVRPQVVEREIDGKTKRVFILDIITPDRVAVMRDNKDPLSITAIVVKLSDTRYSWWTDTDHFVTSNDFNNIVENYGNPFGVIPYVPCFASYPSRGMFHHDQSRGLVDATLHAGVHKTDHNHLRHHQSFKQIWYRSDKADATIPSLVTDPGSAMHVRGQNAQIGVLDMQANLRENLETMLQASQSTLALYGINPQAVRGQMDAQSGYALQIKNHKQQRVQESYSRAWQRNEQSIYRVAQAVWAADGEGSMLPQGKLEIAFADMAPPQNPIEKAELALKLKELGWAEENIYREVFDKDDEWIEQNMELRINERASMGNVPPSLIPASPLDDDDAPDASEFADMMGGEA
jgi:hypothetical protein